MASATDASSGTATLDAPQPRRRKSAALLTSVAAVCALAGGGWYALRPSQEVPSMPQAEVDADAEPAAVQQVAESAIVLPSAPASAIELPRPQPAVTIPAAPQAQADARFAQLEERINRALGELNDSRAQVRVLEQRVAALEAALHKANEQVQALSQKAEERKTAKAGTAAKEEKLEQHAAAPRSAAAPRKKTTVAKRKARARVVRTAAKRPVPVAARMRGQQTPQQRGQGALLAVDMWDGRPSAVIGTGIPGDRRVRVLQPGEQLKGVALVEADARRGSAKFSTGTGVFTMFVDERGAR